VHVCVCLEGETGRRGWGGPARAGGTGIQQAGWQPDLALGAGQSRSLAWEGHAGDHGGVGGRQRHAVGVDHRRHHRHAWQKEIRRGGACEGVTFAVRRGGV
jgi:hypothetical protein